MAVITLIIGEALDDRWGSQNAGASGWNHTSPGPLTTLEVGYHQSLNGPVGYSAYFDHADIQLLRGSTITQALYKPMRSSNENGLVGSPITRVYGDKTSAAPGVCTSYTDFISGRTLTTAFTALSGTAGLPAVGSRYSLDVTSVIQEILAAFPSTIAGINIMHRDNGSAASFTRYKMVSYDESSANAPQLEITYTPAAADSVVIRRRRED